MARTKRRRRSLLGRRGSTSPAGAAEEPEEGEDAESGATEGSVPDASEGAMEASDGADPDAAPPDAAPPEPAIDAPPEPAVDAVPDDPPEEPEPEIDRPTEPAESEGPAELPDETAETEEAPATAAPETPDGDGDLRFSEAADAPTDRAGSPSSEISKRREPFEPLPHWPKPRYVSRHVMMKGHIREPEPEPLLNDWELHLFGGLLALAVGFVLTGGGTLLGLWLAMGNQIFTAVFGGFGS